MKNKDVQFEELAVIAFTQILGNIYSDLRLFTMLGEAAAEKNISAIQEIANQSCEAARVMQIEIRKRTQS